jgi:hypothetical protein
MIDYKVAFETQNVYAHAFNAYLHRITLRHDR